MDTPVPMPNTEVKHRSGDDSRKRQKQHAASLSGPQGDSFFLYFCFLFIVKFPTFAGNYSKHYVCGIKTIKKKRNNERKKRIKLLII